MTTGSRPALKVLIVNPSADTYGSDLQMLETVTALVEVGHTVQVVTTDSGPLAGMLEQRGASWRRVGYPVVRRSFASPFGILRLVASMTLALPRILGTIRRFRPDVIYVNTLTLPWWTLVGRLTRRPTVVHVHEAEADDPKVVRLALNAPLFAATRVILNSETSLETMVELLPRLARRSVVIHNGVPGPPEAPAPYTAPGPMTATIAVIGRLSPRKAPDDAMRAVGLLRERGRDVRMVVAGTAFTGYEWFVEDLRLLASGEHLDGAVEFVGYVDPIWPLLERADIVVAPSTRESLGNAVIEAQLAERPVIATATSGHLESVIDGTTGLLVPVHDVEAIADAIERVLDDPDLAGTLARAARARALEKFDPLRYRRRVVDTIESLAD